MIIGNGNINKNNNYNKSNTIVKNHIKEYMVLSIYLCIIQDRRDIQSKVDKRMASTRNSFESSSVTAVQDESYGHVNGVSSNSRSTTVIMETKPSNAITVEEEDRDTKPSRCQRLLTFCGRSVLSVPKGRSPSA